MTSDILTRVEGRTGIISLNRPGAIHALTTPMCQAMTEALTGWMADPAIDAVMIDHAEGRGFCAGGDIRMLATSGAADGAEAREFFFIEYRLNHLLFVYPKPVIAFMDGITMGGGVGLAMPSRYRIATENTRFAMPETGIGLFPDVGGGWFLSRLPGRVGPFLALTGARLDGAECHALGLATHYLPAQALADAKQRIAAAPQDLEAILAELDVAPPPARILGNREQIDRLFASDRYEDILAALTADGSEWSEKELKTLSTKSPQTCKVALRQLKEGAQMPDFASEMRQEYAIGARVVQMHDFIEGVRALIIEKDNAPRWNPQNAEGVTDALLDTIFAPLPEDQAWTPLEIAR
ncbi:enoyl-CoA hydratase/isomerase family protein [Blastomonas sp. SL216]|uniref:enoyl-CoA hydratase/isomerase family protein n=1 Tax=Blastomonas sp. SL216 TaxID=2995169 RepID=UPI002376E2F9|nr:enoyl-CoA hydratase/isomerase family protein [Blastomonas sp. SL216]